MHTYYVEGCSPLVPLYYYQMSAKLTCLHIVMMCLMHGQFFSLLFEIQKITIHLFLEKAG